ncbi:MAG TPA: hypothetical protein VJN67_00060, partial [Stellaceae bacterium]|nr:hypothetical protein [Stellaceae bacterium]
MENTNLSATIPSFRRRVPRAPWLGVRPSRFERPSWTDASARSDQPLELTDRIGDPEEAKPRGRTRLAIWAERQALWALRLSCLALIGWGATLEARTSLLQSTLFTRATEGMSFALAPGPNAEIRFPRSGPYDERLGYTQLPAAISALGARHFVVERQAVPSPRL